MANKKIAIKCGHMLDITGKFFPDQIILVDKGKIQAVGTHIDIPEDYIVVDASDSWVTPGLIESHGHLGLEDVNEMTSNPIVPHMSSMDAIDPFSPIIRDIRNAGVTTFCSLPGSGCLIAGTGVAIKMKDAVIVEDMVIEECNPLKMAIGENPKMYFGARGFSPMTRMANTALIKKVFYEVIEKLDKGGANAKETLDWEYRILAEALEGKRIVKIHCYTAQDIATAIRISEEFGFKYTLEHVSAGCKIAEYLCKKNVRCCMGPVFSKPCKMEVKDIHPSNAALLAEAGVHFSLIQDSDWEAVYLPSIAGVCVAYGLSSEKALQAITIEAAINIGLSHRIGSVEAGKDADLSVFTGNPLLNTSRCKMTMIDGVLYNNEKGGTSCAENSSESW